MSLVVELKKSRPKINVIFWACAAWNTPGRDRIMQWWEELPPVVFGMPIHGDTRSGMVQNHHWLNNNGKNGLHTLSLYALWISSFGLLLIVASWGFWLILRMYTSSSKMNCKCWCILLDLCVQWNIQIDSALIVATKGCNKVASALYYNTTSYQWLVYYYWQLLFGQISTVNVFFTNRKWVVLQYMYLFCTLKC